MNALLICPQERPDSRFLSQSRPGAILSAFGRPLVLHWLAHVRSLGATRAVVLAADRAEQIHAIVGDGSRWNLDVEVIAESTELTAEEARAKYMGPKSGRWLAQPNDVALMDHFPGLPEHPLFKNYASWFNGLRALLTRGGPEVENSVREIKPGVWISWRARIATGVEFRAPCWVGAHTVIGRDTIIGPMAVIEDRVMVESGVEIANSAVAPETFIGRMTELKHSIADGSILMNWRTASCTRVPDAFLMCSLGKRNPRVKSAGIFARLTALLVLVLTTPFALVPILLAKLLGRPALLPRVAVRPGPLAATTCVETLTYYEFSTGFNLLKCWPQLWNVARGDFVWVGNRPLSPSEVTELASDFERLGLAAPTGLVSLAQVEGALDAIEARAWASLYALQADWRMDLFILTRAFIGANRRSVVALF